MMHEHYNKIFWGFILNLLDIRIGNFDILPDVLGYILIIYGLVNLKHNGEYESFGRAIICAFILMTSLLADVFMPITALKQMTVINTSIMVVFDIVQLCMVYFLLNGSIELLREYGQIHICEDIGKSQEKYVYTNLIIVFLTCFLININEDVAYMLSIAILAASLFVGIWVILLIKRIKNAFLMSI